MQSMKHSMQSMKHKIYTYIDFVYFYLLFRETMVLCYNKGCGKEFNENENGESKKRFLLNCA